MKIIVIGGVAAGMSAASKIKRSIYDAKITVYEKGEDLSYGACGLPYYVGDEIKDHQKMVIRTKKEFEAMGIDVMTHHEVVKVIPSEKKLVIKDLRRETMIEDTYDRLIVATGASPILPPWPGIDGNNIFVLSTLKQGQILKAAVLKEDIRDVTIVGAGFIGIELAETIRGLGKHVRIIEFKNQILSHLDKEVAYQMAETMTANGVELRLGEGVLELNLDLDGDVKGVKTDKNWFPTDLVVVCVGVKPNTSMFEAGEIDRLRNGAIKVNRRMETSIEDIYAAGDCASIYNYVKDTEDDYIPLGTNANKQGKLLGSIISGEKNEFEGVLGTSMIKVFDKEAAKTGLSEREAITLGIDYKVSTVKYYNHAPYYPDPKPIWVKLVAEAATNRILGAQVYGNPGAALRINVFALAIHGRMTTHQIAWADFGYAPPFSSVWDVMHLAGNSIR